MIHTIDLNYQNIPNAIAAFLVETTDGPVLIETGPYSTFPHLRKGIEKLGFSLSDIQHVFLSHVHFDHAGAAWAFAELGANIYLHPIGAIHLADPSRLWDSAKRIYQDQMEVLWGKMKPIAEAHLKTIEDGASVTIGDKTFISHHTPGHAIHHTAWQMDKNLFAGDVAGVRIDKGLVVPPCPPPDINLEDWTTSIKLMRSLDLENLYLTHYDVVDNIEEHLNSLEFCLNDWAQWMKPYAVSNADLKETTVKFQAYVGEQLRAFGISKAEAIVYEAANPSWMSVAGLMRYWKKVKTV